MRQGPQFAPTARQSMSVSGGPERFRADNQNATRSRIMPSVSLQRDAFCSTERHRSRTCLASGYDAVLVLKTSWGTGPSHSTADTN